jgi:hypothetical protein
VEPNPLLLQHTERLAGEIVAVDILRIQYIAQFGADETVETSARN